MYLRKNAHTRRRLQGLESQNRASNKITNVKPTWYALLIAARNPNYRNHYKP